MNVLLGIWFGVALICWGVLIRSHRVEDAYDLAGTVLVSLLWPLWVAAAIVLWSLS